MCCNGSKRMELLETAMSSPVLRKVGTIMLWNGLERMAVLNYRLDQMLLCTGACGLAINSFMCNNNNYVDYH
jgi:Co/Zn/Cd efflux system component